MPPVLSPSVRLCVYVTGEFEVLPEGEPYASGVELLPTGERTAPGLPREDYWFARHEIVYRWSASLGSPGTHMVDAGAGEGYGANMLRTSGAHVTALEYDAAAAGHIARTYPDVVSIRANLDALPLRSASVDVIASLQVIEHLWSLRAFLSDCHRVVRPGGVLILSTPNRPIFSPGLARGERPTNPFHVEEFDAEQLHERVTTAGFADVTMYGVHHGARIRAWETVHGSIVAAQVDAVLTDCWPDFLASFIATITQDDFDITPQHVDAHDLVCTARRPLS